MRQRLTWNRPTFITVLLAFAWNISLLVGVVFDAGFAHSRAAGGQFESFPMGIRIAYGLELALILYQVWIFKLIFHTDPARPTWTPKVFFILGVIGIILNAASRSANERWNVIPAFIITWAFWYFGVKKENTTKS
jgi:hypothetical protein